VVCYAGLGAKDKAFLLLAGAQTKFPSMIDRIDDLSQFVRQSPPAEIHEQKAGSKHYACDTCGSIFLLDPELEILCGDCGSVGPMGSLCQACGNDGIIPLMMLDIEGINVAISCPTCLNGTLSRQR
jgi:hypothetical protein